MRKIYLFLAGIWLGCISLHANTVFVNQNATGTNSGDSWENAFTSLSTALDSAKAFDSLWVAAGVYKPGGTRTDYFALKKDVDLFGGFAGTESLFEERNAEQNVCFLSGDIGVEGTHTDNCKNVVVVPRNTGGSVTIDGFTIAYGYSTDVNWNERSYGAGIWVREGSSPRIQHCLFYMNRTKWGGAIGINAQWDKKSKPIIIHCTFKNNYAWDKGGCINNSGYGNPVVQHCTFIGNSAANSGGAIYSYYNHATIVNSLFIGNSAKVGGAVHHDSGSGGNIYNSSFYGNYSINAGAAVQSRQLLIKNSIVWGNSASTFTDSSLTAQISGVKTASNCIIQHLDTTITGVNNYGDAPMIANIPGYDNIPGTVDDIPFTLIGSPAIDAGDSTLLSKDSRDVDFDGNTTELYPLDMAGNPRIIGANTDIGAFEGGYDMSAEVDMHVRSYRFRDAVNIRWTPSDVSDLTGFKLYRSSALSDWEFLTDVEVQGRGYTIAQNADGETYFYKIVGVTSAGLEVGINNIDAAVAVAEQGNCAKFNGTAQHLDIGNVLPASEDLSLSMWVKLDQQVGDTVALVAQQFVSSLSVVKDNAGDYYLLSLTGDGIAWVDTVRGTTALETGTWNYIAHTYSAADFTQQLFVNRALDTTFIGSLAKSGNENMQTVGAMKDTSGVYTAFFKGLIDELAVWPNVLTLDEVVATMDIPLRDGGEALIAAWHFDEDPVRYQKIAYDGSANQHNLYANTVDYVSSGAMVPSAPVIDSLVYTLDGLNIAWTSEETDIKNYHIYYYTESQPDVLVSLGTVTDTFLLTSIVEPTREQLYFYVESEDYAGNISQEVVTEPFEFLFPGSPANFHGTADANAVTLSWEAVNDAVSFDIFRADTNDIAQADLLANIPADSLNFVDVDMVDEHTYHYFIQSINAFNLRSEPSSDSVYYVIPRPAMIDTLMAEIQAASVKLQWTPVETAVSYQIFRAETSDSTAAAIVETVNSADTVFEDATVADSTVYFYWVNAINEYGKIGYLSGSATVDFHLNIAPIYAPEIAEIVLLNGANPDSISLNSYFTDPEADQLTFVAEVAGDDIAEISILNDTLFITQTGNGSATLTLTAADVFGASASATIAVSAQYIPDAPEALEAEHLAHSVQLSWGAVETAVSYQLYRSETEIFADAMEIADTATVNMQDTSVASGTTYFYWVQARNEHGNMSSLSDSIRIEYTENSDPVLLQPFAPLTIEQEDLPTVYTLADYFSDTDELAYSASIDDNTVAQAIFTESEMTIVKVGVGICEVSVTATDSWGASVTGSFTVEVVGEVACSSISISGTVTSADCHSSSTGAVSALAEGGVEPYAYKWSTTSTSSAISGLEAGTYLLTVTDANACAGTAEFVVTEPEMLEVTVDVTNAHCGNTDGSADVLVSGGTEPYSYNWAVDSTGSSISNAGAGIYLVTITDNANCTIDSAIEISEIDGPVASVVSVSPSLCSTNEGAISIEVSQGEEPYTFEWNDGSDSQNRTGLSIGNYTVEVTDASGCKAVAFGKVSAIKPVQNEICAVSVNADGKNMLMWDKVQSADELALYRIYRESTASGVYESIGTVSYDEVPLFIDESADPTVRAWRYKLQAEDACGNQSPLSTEHKTIHLAKNMGIGNEVNLQWNLYEGRDLYTYKLYRFSESMGQEELAIIPANITSYTDYSVPAGTVQYQIAVELPEVCDPNNLKTDSGPYSQSLSNLAEAIISVSTASDTQSMTAATVYPVPATSFVTVSFGKQIEQGTICVINTMGTTVLMGQIQQSDKIELPVSELPAESYIIQITEGDKQEYLPLIITD